MNRRTYLALAGSSLTASVAGCLQETVSSEEGPQSSGQDLLETEREPRQFQYDAQNTGVTGVSAPADVTRRWKTTLEPIGSSLSVIDDRLVVAASGWLHALDTDDGAVLWKEEIANGFSGAPALTEDTAYVVATGLGYRFDQGVVAINLEDGSERWRVLPNTGAYSAPTLADETVYVGGNQDRSDVIALDAADGSERWRSEVGEYASTPAVSDGTVYVGGGKTEKVYGLDAETGEEVWHIETDGEMMEAPTVVEGTVYASSGSGRLYALDDDDGTEQWSVNLDDLADETIPDDAEPVSQPTYRDYVFPTSVSATSGTVYAATNTAIFALDSDGEHQWSQPGGSTHPPVRAGDKLLISSEDAVCLDAESGEKLWDYPVERRILTDTTASDVGHQPVVMNGTVFVGANGGYVYALEEENT